MSGVLAQRAQGAHGEAVACPAAAPGGAGTAADSAGVGRRACDITGALCGLPDPKAIDWTHANSLGWSAQDGDLTVSLRHISLVIKIAFEDGHGDGGVIWRLGQGGDFTVKSSDPSPWFSYQHDAHFVNATTLVVYDDGNQRCQNGKVKGCQSRGQEWQIDEKHHTATPLVSVDLGQYWQALGSAQALPNGNLTFAGGFAPTSKEVEVSPNGAKVYELDCGVGVSVTFPSSR